MNDHIMLIILSVMQKERVLMLTAEPDAAATSLTDQLFHY
jgi:hypothetical protein